VDCDSSGLNNFARSQMFDKDLSLLSQSKRIKSLKSLLADGFSVFRSLGDACKSSETTQIGLSKPR
jgi:hypothetical protein